MAGTAPADTAVAFVRARIASRKYVGTQYSNGRFGFQISGPDLLSLGHVT